MKEVKENKEKESKIIFKIKDKINILGKLNIIKKIIWIIYMNIMIIKRIKKKLIKI